MALPKPPKDYYRLEEIALEWGWSIDDLFNFGEQGKLEISVWLPEEWAEPIYLDQCVPLGEEYTFTPNREITHELKPKTLRGVYALSKTSVRGLREDGKIYRVNTRPDEKSAGAVCWDFEPTVQLNHQLFPLVSLVITHEERVRFETEIKAGLSGSDPLTSNDLIDNKDAFGNQAHTGSPLVGWKAMAKELGVHSDTVRKTYSKNPTFPLLRSQTGNGNGLGKPAAFASELKKWRLSKNK